MLKSRRDGSAGLLSRRRALLFEGQRLAPSSRVAPSSRQALPGRVCAAVAAQERGSAGIEDRRVTVRPEGVIDTARIAAIAVAPAARRRRCRSPERASWRQPECGADSCRRARDAGSRAAVGSLSRVPAQGGRPDMAPGILRGGAERSPGNAASVRLTSASWQWPRRRRSGPRPALRSHRRSTLTVPERFSSAGHGADGAGASSARSGSALRSTGPRISPGRYGPGRCRSRSFRIGGLRQICVVAVAKKQATVFSHHYGLDRLIPFPDQGNAAVHSSIA